MKLFILALMLTISGFTSPRQYKPFNLKLEKMPLLVYPVKDESPLSALFKDQHEIQEHLAKLYRAHPHLLSTGDYHILFVWNLEGERMTDIWIHSMKNWSDSGPLIECSIYRGLHAVQDAGIASGDSLIVLGREEELRRCLGPKTALNDYLDREKHFPEFPLGLKPDQIFISSQP